MGARRLVLISIMSLATGGCAFLERSSQPIAPYPSVTDEKLESANTKGLRIWRVLQTEDALLDSIPVGTILAHYNPTDLSLPENWKYCNGDIVMDERSPFFGKRLPKITDNRFPMFTTRAFGGRGGSNRIVADGLHDHGGKTGSAGEHAHGGRTLPPTTNGEIKQIGKDDDTGVRMNEQNHRHGISKEPDHSHMIGSGGEHNHGGDKTPRWFGTLCIIKIK